MSGDHSDGLQAQQDSQGIRGRQVSQAADGEPRNESPEPHEDGSDQWYDTFFQVDGVVGSSDPKCWI